jgi:transposase
MVTMKQYNVVQQASKQGLTITGIEVKVGRDRKTVRKYLRMDKDEFLQYLSRMAERGKVFEPYRSEILEIYTMHEGRTVYASSVLDYLGERHGELPGSERTLRNYLRYLKASGAIGTGLGREFRPVEALAYGKQAQIDFGIESTNIGKIWFVAVVLARSRYRYGAAQARPFTAMDVIGHLLDAFEFFGGIPEELVLDQDRTMLVEENLGDLVMTKSFTDFVQEQGFRLWACRAADPQSKGKVENAIKYVKTSFFSSRSFASFEELSLLMKRWLLRANAKISQATRMMPLTDFETHEKPTLKPLRASIFRASLVAAPRESRKADQKSLISVGATRYSVPSRYRNAEVEIERKDNLLLIYDPKSGIQIAVHRESLTQGGTVLDKSHYRDREASQEVLHGDLVARFSDMPSGTAFIDQLWKEYRRYFRDHASRLVKFLDTVPDREKLESALQFCIDHRLSSARDLIEVYVSHSGEYFLTKKPERAALGVHGCISNALPAITHRSVNEYQRLLDEAVTRTGGTI